MNTDRPLTSELQAATDALVEFALMTLEPQYLRWDKFVNMSIAEGVWNLGPRALDLMLPALPPDPMLE